MSNLAELPEAADPETRPRREPRPGSLGDLLTRLVEDVVVLVRAEIRLASTEMRGKAAAAGGSVAAILVGFTLLSVAMVFLLGAGVAFLALYVGIVAAALIFAGGAAVLGGILIFAGVSKVRRMDLAPRRSIAMLKRSADTLKGE